MAASRLAEDVKSTIEKGRTMSFAYTTAWLKSISLTLCILTLSACGGGGGSESADEATGPVAPAPSESPSPSPSPAPVQPATLTAPIVLADGTSVGTRRWADGSTANGGKGQLVAGLSCAEPADTAYTFSHLSVFLDGQQLMVPAEIGVQNSPVPPSSTGCMYPLRTNDTSGKIRMEANSGTPFTLGQFFALWGRPLSNSTVADITGKPVVAYINDGGNLRRYEGDLASLPLFSQREVTLQIGSPLQQIPTYSWVNPPPLSAQKTSVFPGLTLGRTFWPSGNTATGGQGQPVDGLECKPMNETYHAHTHLSIFRNGERLAIPAFTGMASGCVYSLHTHDQSGALHVEGEVFQRFTLGQFFNIWGRPLTRENVAGITGLPVTVFVTDGGSVRQHTGDIGDIELLSHRSITIQLGSPLNQIPAYDWSDSGFPN